jgi:hypothetical protein
MLRSSFFLGQFPYVEGCPAARAAQQVPPRFHAQGPGDLDDGVSSMTITSVGRS